MSRPTQYAGVILVTKDNHILLQRRESKEGLINSGKIAIFGGTNEEGESPIDCAIREMYEEVRLTLNPSELLLLSTYNSPDISEIGFAVESHVFIAPNIVQNDIVLQEGESVFVLENGMDFENLNLTRICRLALTDFFKNKLGDKDLNLD